MFSEEVADQRLEIVGEAHAADGTILRLSSRAWNHVRNEHPEMRPYQAKILETVSAPDLIAAGATGELKAIKWFDDLHVGPKYLIAVYRKLEQQEGFILTAYLTSDLQRACKRGVVWRKS